MTDTRRKASGILEAAVVGDLAWLRGELATADSPQGGPVEAGEQERQELLAAVVAALRETFATPLAKQNADAAGEAAGRLRVYLGLLRHLAGPGRPARPYVVRTAIASISTRTSRGNRAASMVARAGALSAK